MVRRSGWRFSGGVTLVFLSSKVESRERKDHRWVKVHEWAVWRGWKKGSCVVEGIDSQDCLFGRVGITTLIIELFIYLFDLQDFLSGIFITRYYSFDLQDFLSGRFIL